MSDADKIKYLEGWVEKLGAERDMYKSAWTFQDRQGRELTERVKQLETELAAAKAEIGQYSMKPPASPNPAPVFMDDPNYPTSRRGPTLARDNTPCD